MTSQNKNISNESAVSVKRSRSIIKARVIILAVVFAILATGAIGFLTLHIKGWVLIPKMHHFEYYGVDKGTGGNDAVTTIWVGGLKCKYTFEPLWTRQKYHGGKLYLKDGSTLGISYIHPEPGCFVLSVDGYDGDFVFSFDPESNRPARVVSYAASGNTDIQLT